MASPNVFLAGHLAKHLRAVILTVGPDQETVRADLEVNLEEGEDVRTDLCCVRLQGEVACVVEDDLCAGIVALVSLGARGDEERIVRTPNCQHGRLTGAQICLPLGIALGVVLVIP